MSAREKGPEKYSVDAMITRLQGGAEDGEEQIVTRDDGTKVRKVRRRKRRSDQPVYEEREKSQKLRLVKIAALIGLVGLVPIAFGSWFVYLNTNTYRTRLEKNIAHQLGGSVKLVGQKVTPLKLSANQATFTNESDSLLKKLELVDVRGDLRTDTIFRKTWLGDKLIARQGFLHLDYSGKKSQTQPERPLTAVTFSDVVSQHSKVLLGDEAKPAITLEDTEVSYTPQAGANQFRLSFSGGTLLLADFPAQFAIDRSTLTWDGNQCEALIRIQPPKGYQSLMLLTGVFALSEEKPSRLKVELKSYAFEGLVSPNLGKLLYGSINSDDATTADNQLVFNPAKRSDALFEVHAKGNALDSPLAMRGFPFLDQLSYLFNDRWFLNPTFTQDSKFVLTMNDRGTSLKQIALEAKNRLKIEGQLLALPNGELSGTLEIGVPLRMVAEAEKPTKLLFSQERDGYRWATIQLSGNSSAPSDNLEAQVRKFKGQIESSEQAERVNSPAPASSGSSNSGNSEFDKLINGQ